MQGFDEHLITFHNKFNKFSNTGEQMQDSIDHMTLKSHFIRNFGLKRLYSAISSDVVMESVHNVSQRIQVICINNLLVYYRF